MKKIFSLILLCLSVTLPAASAAPEVVDEMSMTLEENIAYPRIAAKKAAHVRKAMTELRRKLADRKFRATLDRDGEVVCVTIPAADLFRANSREVSPEGRRVLESLTRYVSHREQFKVLVAVHSDDTGDEQYSDELTSDRANAIDDYFNSAAGREVNLIPYGIGRDEPVGGNATVKSRAANRRVEIFFVPTIAYIKHLTK
jgi:outer membrane protein OmpA-like peptidoglycan-associated protein